MCSTQINGQRANLRGSAQINGQRANLRGSAQIEGQRANSPAPASGSLSARSSGEGRAERRRSAGGTAAEEGQSEEEKCLRSGGGAAAERRRSGGGARAERGRSGGGAMAGALQRWGLCGPCGCGIVWLFLRGKGAAAGARLGHAADDDIPRLRDISAAGDIMFGRSCGGLRGG